MILITNLEEAYKTLKQCYVDFQSNQNSVLIEYIEDSCVKRFEYTLETAWKLMKKILAKKYGKTQEELTINNIFRFMQGYGYTENWENWKKYYELRNNTAHEYNLIKSRELMKIIPDFIRDAEFLISKLSEESDDN
ncbi:MAG: nucleotidyltransferase substrate binding protein [bacterium]|nr:nucleotidyltransferase substrate binding protein [bacterium]